MHSYLEIQRPKNRARYSLLASFLLGLTFAPLSLAQHEMHNMPAIDAVLVASMPDNDEVLVAAPESIILHFESEVRLVKLVLKESRQGMIDIQFRYHPKTGVHFMQALPALEAADYYTAEWAVFDVDGKLIKGVFYFSFGDDAKPASYYLDLIDHPVHIMSPDYRLL